MCISLVVPLKTHAGGGVPKRLTEVPPMPEQLSKLLSRLQANLPQFTRGELVIMVILAVAVVAAGLFVLLKPRT